MTRPEPCPCGLPLDRHRGVWVDREIDDRVCAEVRRLDAEAGYIVGRAGKSLEVARPSPTRSDPDRYVRETWRSLHDRWQVWTCQDTPVDHNRASQPIPNSRP